jgi:hypothetical protein
VAGFFLALSLVLMPKYLQRLLGERLDQNMKWRGQTALMAIFIAHYALPRSLKFYYVYDFPAVAFSMILFLGLTAPAASTRLLALAVAPIFALNRETVIIAVLHAGAWYWTHKPEIGVPFKIRITFKTSLLLGAAAILILISRLALNVILVQMAQDNASWIDEGQLRLLVNIHRILTKHHHALALLWFGAGAILWLPQRWRTLPPVIKALMVSSVPPLILFALAGNIVELRMFSEFIPLLASALAFRRQTTSPPTGRL